jgi:hypothetical protein
MIVERAARCQQIAIELRKLATRLEGVDASANGSPLKAEAAELRALADQVQKL